MASPSVSGQQVSLTVGPAPKSTAHTYITTVSKPWSLALFLLSIMARPLVSLLLPHPQVDTPFSVRLCQNIGSLRSQLETLTVPETYAAAFQQASRVNTVSPSFPGTPRPCLLSPLFEAA